MMAWVQSNIASIVVAAILLVAVALIVRRLILNKKAGKHSCGCSCGSCGGNCAGCPMHNAGQVK